MSQPLIRSRIFGVILLLPLSSLSQETVMEPAAGAADFLRALVQGSNVPGIQYVVVDSGGIVFEYTGGWADIAQRIPMRSSTLLLAYSMTKTLTAAAILQLADQGRLRLDDAANDYLDVNPYGTSVTIRQMLSHTSGIPNPNPLRWIHPAGAHWARAEEDSALRTILSENGDLDRKPGHRYAYSNINYWLLGKIIERVSGLGFQEYLRKNIFDPLEIADDEMGFAMDPRLTSKGYLARWSLMNLLKRFFIDDVFIGDYEEGGWLTIRGHSVNGAAYGGAVGSARGFAKFLQDQLRPSSRLFSDSTKRIFFEQQTTNSGIPVPMTPGWHIGELDGETFFYKEGGGGGFHCEMRIYPRRHIATVSMTNETSAKVKGYLDTLDPMFFPVPVTSR